MIPDGQNSDHPNSGTDTGPSWVATVVNAIGQSQYWNDSAIVIVWDDWGGFYDPVAPPLPRDNQGGPGLRVPLIVVSPYAREAVPSQPGYISNTFYEFGSIVRFVEDTFGLGRLGTTDSTSKQHRRHVGLQSAAAAVPDDRLEILALVLPASEAVARSGRYSVGRP